MKRCLIIGAGQLGSRHLQGILKYKESLEIYIVDLSESSLAIAKEREKELTHNHFVHYSQNWNSIPRFLDLVIIATSANVREDVISKLVNKHKVAYLVLEKVLFQELDAYKRVELLISKNQITTYVNHPRRMFDSYQSIKRNLKLEYSNLYTVFGGNWGLGCNSLHFLDLFVFLSGKKIQSLNLEYVDNILIKSSRKGFVEFCGTITGSLEDNSFFSISSFIEETSPLTITINNIHQRFIIQEGGTPKVYELSNLNLFDLEIKNFNIEFQSNLTTIIANDIFSNQSPNLTSFKDARHTHEIFIKCFLEKYNKITGNNSDILPIT